MKKDWWKTKKHSWQGIAKAAFFFILAMSYLFWTVDIIPDKFPVIGFVDDAILLLVAAWVIRGNFREILSWAKKVL